MADALGYTAEPVKPKQAAMDAAMAYKAGKQVFGGRGGGRGQNHPECFGGLNSSLPAKADKEQAATSKPKKDKVNCEIVPAEVDMADQLTDIVNWAYRGKAGEQVGWVEVSRASAPRAITRQ